MPETVNWRSERNVEWRLWRNDDNTFANDQVKLALLMDIREGLKPLQQLYCTNFRRIPRTLRAIENSLKPERIPRAVAHRRAVRRAAWRKVR